MAGVRSTRYCGALLAVLAPLVSALLIAPGPAQATVSCPNPNPVVNENECNGPGSSAWQVEEYSPDLGGYTTQSSVNLGQNVVLKIGRNAPVSSNATVAISVFRMGYYGGRGGRLMHQATGVPINNDYTCNPMDPVTGLVDCGNWLSTYTIPGNALPASGVYLAKLTASTGEETAVVFTVRDDSSHSKLLYVLPDASYQAYNTFGGKSLYFGTEGGNTVSGTGRAVKVSFNRPLAQAGREHNWFFGPDFDLLQWLEKQGYEVSYTDDVQIHLNPQQLLQHDTLVISGHSEYWSLEQFSGVLAARNAGVNIASFSSNTAYWKVRYENAARTLVCYKTVEGSGAGGSGSVSANDWGPDGIRGTADDALGLDGLAGTADDNPQNATTTFRDNGAPPGDPGAPPGGRVGPDMPENQIFGVMYVGDNDSRYFPLTIPAGNANGEFAADRIWRNTGISENTSTDIIPSSGSLNFVGWEWDAVPTQAQYLSRQPEDVVRLSASNVQVAEDNSWLQDEGRLRSTIPPPGQPGTVNAVKYTAPSGALVFATGTMMWSFGLSGVSDERIEQATYNVLSDTGAQPGTPSGITLDPGGSNRAPNGSFAITPNPAKTTDTVTFDASASADPDGSIVDYKWDLDGNGSFETDTGSTATVTHQYSSEGEVNVRLLVTDNGGATDLAVRTITIIDNQPPAASFTATPNPVIAGMNVTLDGSASSDPDGSISRYEWDLDGNGSFETDGGSSPTIARSYASAGTVNVGLRVTDNGGKTATTSRPVTVSPPGISSYADAVLNTPGLLSYWRMGDSSGPNFTDSAGSSPATASNGVTFGVPGGVVGDPNAAARFDGLSGSAAASLNLSATNKVTVEFWLKWNFANDDHIAMEFTSNYHENSGGFLIDPNAPQEGGMFAVGLGRNGSFNTAYFPRPSSGQWHHYAFVLDTAAPAAEEIRPYVDGKAVSYIKPNSGTGAGNFANSVLYFMSRAGSSNFGAGDLDEVAIYNQALDPATIAEHYESYGTNRRPVAAFTATPNVPKPGQQVTFDASGSYDPDGSIVNYKWDLDGNGSFETDAGTSPTVTHTYSAEGEVNVGLRVTDNLTGTDVVTHNLSILSNQPPTASFSATPNPVLVDSVVTLDASASSDPDGSITHYEWDLDGNGSFETDGASSPTITHSYAPAGTVNVGLRVTDNGGKTGTTSRPVTVSPTGISTYPDAVLNTPGLLSYWRMGEASGPTFADSAGSSPATASVGGVSFGVPGGVVDDPNAAARFDGLSGSASTAINLSATSKVTVELWMRWNSYTNNDALAFEYTSNFNNVSGGFLVDPNSTYGKFAVSLGRGGSRNIALFNRPTAGQWHHYAFVLNTTAPAAEEITPYVDGQAVPFTKPSSGTGAGNFANSVLYFMSRAGTSLFGAGDLDEVAIYGRALDPATIAEHYESHGTNRRPVAAFTGPSTAKPGQQVTFDASGSEDPDGSIVDYQWDLDGNGSFETDTGTTPAATHVYSAEGGVNVGLRVTDDQTGTDVVAHSLNIIANQAPTASFSATPNPVIVGGSVTFDASASFDPDGSIADYEWDLDGNGSYETNGGSIPTISRSYASAGTVNVGLRVTDDSGGTATTSRSLTVKPSYPDAVRNTPGLLSYWRMGDASGPTFADSAGSSPATASGGVTFGVSGAIQGDPNTAATFNGTSGSAAAAVNLSATSQVTIEFWLRWTSYANNDALAFEYTSNFNSASGGFLVDPNSTYGKFAVSLGKAKSRNITLFNRPTAGQWHHYTLVLNTTAPAAEEIIPYVDGQAVPYSKPNSGTGAGNFANSVLYFMSRAGGSLFGSGDLDEVAVYNRALDAATVATHYEAH